MSTFADISEKLFGEEVQCNQKLWLSEEGALELSKLVLS